MNNAPQLQNILTAILVQSPVLLVSLVGCIVVLVKWRQGSRGSVWAMLGFVLSLMLCTLIPVFHTSLQSWAVQQGDFAQRSYLLHVFSFIYAVMRAISYALLLVAIFAGRSLPQPATPSLIPNMKNPYA